MRMGGMKGHKIERVCRLPGGPFSFTWTTTGGSGRRRCRVE